MSGDFADRMASHEPVPGMTTEDMRRLGELVDAEVAAEKDADPESWPEWLA